MDEAIIPGRLVVCALARDCAASLEQNIPKIERLRSRFSEAEVIIFENDSKDNTKQRVEEWSAMSTGVNLISENYFTETIKERDQNNPSPGTSIHRIQKMAKYRNRYIEWINQQSSACDYVLVIDIDVRYFSVEGVVDAIKNAPTGWGGLFAYGYTDSRLMKLRFYKVYHDLYALLIKRPTSLPYVTFPQMFKNSKAIKSNIKDQPYYPVASAFGGIGIYKFEAIKGLKYTCERNRDDVVEAICEHIPFNLQVLDRGFQHYICKNMEVYYGETSKIMVLRNVLPLKIFKLLAFLVTFKKLKA